MTTETEVKQEEGPAEDPRPVAEAQDSSPGAGFALAMWHMVERLARWTAHQLTRPRIRTSVVGIILILIAAFFVGHSFWTAPLVIVGALMIIVAWVGSRLEGRFAMEWSETGTGFEMRARFKSSSAAAVTRQVTAETTAHSNSTMAHPRTTHTASSTTATPSADDDVIDGEAHTMEIDAAELRALVAAIEQVAPLAHRVEDRGLTHVSTTGHIQGDATAPQTLADEA